MAKHTIREIRDLVIANKTRLSDLKKREKYLSTQATSLQEQLRIDEQARNIIQIVAQRIQDEIKNEIAAIGTLAVQTVFGKKYKIGIEFEAKRGKTEAIIYIDKDGITLDPMDSGGGIADVTAFGLRVSCLRISRMKNKVGNILLLDEPFKHVKGVEANELVLSMVHQLAEALKMQVIMVSDERVERDTILQYADMVYEFKDVNGVSQVTKVK